MDGTSLTPEQEKLNALKQVLPEVFAEGKVDWEKLKATLGEDINFSNERYVLNWAGKSEAFKVLQAPTTKTLVPAKNESVNFDKTENIFIEGENLEVLKVLQKSYFGKVKMIYIDPPYNTGNDSFIYPDKFSETKEDYEKRVGDKDEDGYMTKDGMFKKNSKENGQYHSNWLNMMYPRLFLAKNLLKQDGVIFISIDDNEVHNLRLLMNEVFGEENFVSELMWKKRVSPANDSQWFSSDHEYILVYAKNKENWFPERLERNAKQNSYYTNPDNDSRGPWNSAAYTCNKNKDERPNLYYPLINPNNGQEVWPKETAVWAYSKETHQKHIKEDILYWGSDGKSKSPRKKQFLSDAKRVVSRSFLEHSDVGSTQSATLDFLKLFEHNYFNYTKPVELIKRLIKVSSKTDNSEIIMDFFAGSGTTAHSLMDLKKEIQIPHKYICVQLPELCEEKSQAYKDGYKTIADISKERIRRAGNKIKEEIQTIITKSKSEIKKLEGELPTDETKTKIENLKTKIELLKNQDLGFKVLKLSDSNFKQWQQITGNDKQALEEQMQLFIDPVAKNATTENMVYELMLKSGKDLNSNIEVQEDFYVLNNYELVFLLKQANQKIIDLVISKKPKKVIALDKLFKGNDQLKTNASLQMKDAGIEFKTI
jgi:adenine-specific DNA-methyltransferase